MTKIQSRVVPTLQMNSGRIQLFVPTRKLSESFAPQVPAQEQNKRKGTTGKNRFIKPDVVYRAIPCSERSVQVKLTLKIHENQRQKKNLDGLYEVLAPGSTVCKISPTTSVIKEPYKPEVRVRNSDIAKFGTRAERETELTQYIERRPKKINEKTLEQKIQQHKRDLFRKNTGEK